MTTAIVTLTPTDLGSLAQTASAFVVEASAPNTRKAYARDFATFEAWCLAAGLRSLPAEPTTVGLYMTHLAGAGKKVSTIERALAAIVTTHRKRGFEWPKGHPAVRDVLAGIRRTIGTAPKQKDPVMDQDLARMVGTLGVDTVGMRDRALLTVGWFGAFRRSELVELDVHDARFVNDGLIMTLSRSKTDQEGKGYEKGLPYAGQAAVCPVRSLRAWLETSHITHGPLFRAVDGKGNVSSSRMSDRTVARIVQRAAVAAGVTSDVAGHSLRSGFATSAAAKGKQLVDIMRQGGWKSDRVARGYVRHGTIFVNNPAAGLL